MEKMNFGGRYRPIAFSLRMQYVFEEKFERSCTAAISDLIVLGLAAQQPGLLQDDMVRRTTQIRTLAQLAWSALVAGADEEGEPVDFTVFKVVGWIDDDPEASEKIVERIIRSLPRANEALEGKKKTTKNQMKARP